MSEKPTYPGLTETMAALAKQHHLDEEHADYLTQIFKSVYGLAGDNPDLLTIKIINSALKELRYASRVFARYRDRRKVSVFGSARTKSGDPNYLLAEEFSRKISEKGYMVITGAGPGIMEAGHKGAGADNIFGVGIRLPFEQASNPYIEGDPKMIHFKYFFTRKLMFVKESHALVCFPGGFGTHDEMCETLTLVQTGKSPTLPIVLLDAPGGGYWKSWDEYVRKHMLEKGMISEVDLSLYRLTDKVETAVEEVCRFYRNYHSQRFVGDLLVLRCRQVPKKAPLKQLDQKFVGLLSGGGFASSPALPEEADEPELRGLPRILFKFNRRNFGGLRQLIDEINGWDG